LVGTTLWLLRAEECPTSAGKQSQNNSDATGRPSDSVVVVDSGLSDFRAPDVGMACGRSCSASGRCGYCYPHHRLLEKIGEGGFGVVFMAEQCQPIWRTVALKIIKPGMDTGEVIARFEAERQALAVMDHPNIAHVLDGGATESGRPYFVMELVQGMPITESCDLACGHPLQW